MQLQEKRKIATQKVISEYGHHSKQMAKLSVLALVAALLGAVRAQKVELTENNAEYCSGMYSKVDWGGPVEPFIKVELDSFQTANPATNEASVAMIVFEYQDIDKLGVTDPASGRKRYICDEALINEGLCSQEQLNQFIVDPDVATVAPVKTALLTELGTNDFSYHVVKTGYYCIAAYNPAYGNSNENKFKMKVNYHNAFGNLPASDIPMLPLYGLLTIVYAVCLSVFLFQIYVHRSELLLLQKYLAGFFTFLTIENLLTWSLYEAENNNKKFPMSAGIQVYIVIISCLNAFKVAFSFFLLLIIALGYGVVHPKLPNNIMDKCKLIGAVQFMALLAFTCVSYYVTQSQPGSSTTDTKKGHDNGIDDNSLLVLFVTIPNALMFVVLYYAILFNMKNTMLHLRETNQVVKFGMYKKLIRVIAASMVLLLVGLGLSSFVIFSDSLNESIERFWKFNNVVTAFWPAVVYFIVFIGVAFIWRPSDTSYLLAASAQIPQNPSEAGENVGNANLDLGQFGGNDFEFDDLRSFDADPFGQAPQKPKANNQQPPTSTSDDATSAENPFTDPVEDPFKDPLPESTNNDGFVLSDEEDDVTHSAKTAKN